MKIKYTSDHVVESLRRLVELSKILQKHNDPIIYAGIKRESTILLRRTIKLWVDIRVGENWLPWKILNTIKTRKRLAAAEALQGIWEDLPEGFFDEEDDDEESEY